MTSTSDNTRFYADLEPFAEFDRVTEFSAYRPVPDDWVVMAGDIAGSTEAIAEGHYKAVNMMGAAVITATLNACPGVQVPFVFGGDGGAVVVPARCAGDASRELRRLQAHSCSSFGLTLRCAAVPVGRIRREGSDLRVRRMTLNGTNHLAMFAGGGIDHVDSILKLGAADDRDILSPDEDDMPPDLDGLSCRWEPLVATRDRMIALMIQPTGDDNPVEVLRAVLARLRAILDQSIPAHAPVSDRTLRFRWPPQGLGLEARATAGGRSVLRTWSRAAATALIQAWCHWRGTHAGAYDAPRYQEELKAQTDFRKFDGCLRTVLDCSDTQIDAIESWLEAEYRCGRLVYGLHTDRAALMTCLVFSIEQSEHVHFIDAAGGGFARAAEGFKARLENIRSGTIKASE